MTTTVLEILDRLSDVATAVGCLVAIGVVGATDYLTKVPLSFSIFYLLPVLVGAHRSRRFGIRISVASALVWLAADVVGRLVVSRSVFVTAWNVSFRFLVFCIVVALIDALRRSLVLEQRLSRRDKLTELANYRGFHDQARLELDRMSRTGRPLTVAYLDIDNFKRLNDRLGHAAGDEVIVATAGILSSHLRGTDTVARIGGDEFALLLPDTDASGAVMLLERVHGGLLNAASQNDWAIGYSGGAATFPTSEWSVEAMVAEADRVMYEVKRSGKNAMGFSHASGVVPPGGVPPSCRGLSSGQTGHAQSARSPGKTEASVNEVPAVARAPAV